MTLDVSSIKFGTQVDLPKLRHYLVEYFDESELQDLAFDLEVDYENLPVTVINKSNKARALISLFERRGQIGRLLQACIEARPHIEWQAVALIMTDERPPFKGLDVFEEEDADLFFGREEITGALVLRLTQSIQQGGGAFLAVVGASGSGKSSLVRAGLIPVLKQGLPMADGTHLTEGVDWPIHVISPSVHPLESLAISLTREEESVTAVNTLITDLQDDPNSFYRYVRRQLDDKKQRLLLFVDQFEEIFTLCDSEEERVAFVNNLMTAANHPNSQIVLIITLRADFYAQCSQYDDLRDELELHQKFLGPMSDHELRAAIEKPAHNVGYNFESGLVSTLLREVGHEPGALPLLSHALLEAWKRRRGKVLTFEAYNEAGGIHGAIAKTADSVYEYQLSPAQQDITRRIFISLTEIGEAQDTRRRASLAELIRHEEEREAVEAVLRILTRARLIIVGEETAEVAHEALIREWPILRRWLDDNREALRIQRQLQEDAEAWRRLGEDAGALYRGVRLATALEWATAHDEDLIALSRRFLLTSREVVRREEAEREAQRRRELETAQQLAETQRQRAEEQAQTATKLRQWANYLVGLVVIALLLAGAAAYAMVQARTRTTELDAANKDLGIAHEQAQQKTRRAESTALAAQARALFNQSPQLGLLLAVESVQLLQSEDPRVPEAEEALWYALSNVGGRLLFEHENIVKAVALSPDGRWLVSGSEDFTIHVHDLTDPNFEPLILYGSAGPIFALAVAPDNDTVFAGSWNGQLYVWSLEFPEAFVLLEAGSGTIETMAISEDGRWLVTGGDDGTANLWDMENLDEPRYTFTGHAGAVTAVAISADSQQVATASDDGQTLLWDLANLEVAPRSISRLSLAFSFGGGGPRERQPGQPPPPPPPPSVLADFVDSAVYGVTFSPDGEWLITAGGTPPWVNPDTRDYAIHLWDIEDYDSPPIALTGHEGYVTDVAVSSDSQWLISTSWDRTSRVWNMENLDAPPVVLHGHEDFVTDVHISADNTFMVTASADHTIRLWDLTFLNSAPRTLAGHRAPVRMVAISPDNSWLATAGDAAVVWLWNLEQPNHEPLRLTAHDSPIIALAMSQDGRWLVSSDEQGAVYLWEMAGFMESQTMAHEPAALLQGHDGAVTTLAMSGDSHWLVTGSMDNTARLWDLRNPQSQPIVLRGHEGSIFAVTISADNRWLVTASGDGTMRLWDLTNPGVDQRILTGHAAAVTAVAISPDNRWLISASQDHTARLWDLTDPTVVSIPLRGHSDGILAVTVSSDSQWAATGGLDNVIRLWHLVEPTAPPRILRGHSAWITDLAMSADGRWLASGSFDHTVRLWDLPNPEIGAVVLSGHTGSIQEITISPDSRWLLSASADGTAQIWPLRTEELIQMACATAGRNLTRAEWEQYLANNQYHATCDNLPAGETAVSSQ